MSYYDQLTAEERAGQRVSWEEFLFVTCSNLDDLNVATLERFENKAGSWSQCAVGTLAPLEATAECRAWSVASGKIRGRHSEAAADRMIAEGAPLYFKLGCRFERAMTALLQVFEEATDNEYDQDAASAALEDARKAWRDTEAQARS